MSTKKDAFNKTISLLRKLFADEIPPVKLSDGTVIESTLEPGSAVAFLDADGNATPASVGEYELEDARILVVTEEGIVAEVKEKDAPADPPAEDQDMTALKSELAATKAELEKVRNDFSAHKATADKYHTDTTGILKEMFSLLEVLSKEESAEAAETPRQTAFSKQREAKTAARERMLNGFKKFSERAKQ